MQHISLLAMVLLAPPIAIGLMSSFELAGRLQAGAAEALRTGAHLAAHGVMRAVEAEVEALDPAIQAQRFAALPVAPLGGAAAAPDEVVLRLALPGGERSVPVARARLEAAMGGPGLPAGGFALLADPAGRVVARAPPLLAPETLPAWLTVALAAPSPALLRGPGADRVPLVLAAEALPFPGWTLLAGQAEARFDAGWRSPALRQLAAALLVGALGLGFAAWFAGRLQRGLPRLDAAAPAPAGARVREFESLGRAMREAQAALRGEAGRAAEVAAENRRLAQVAADDRQLLLSIMQSAPDPIFVKDTSLRYVLVNEVAARTAASRPLDVIGHADPALVGAAEAALLNAQDREVMASGTSREFERAYTDPVTGQRRLLRTLKAPWRSRTGEIIGIVGVGRDVTEREEADRRLRAAEEALRRIARADTLTIMSLGIAHELNQPLTAASNFLRAALRWLERGAEDPARLTAARGVIEEAAAETLRAAEILRRLRDFIGHGETERAVIELAPLLAETVALMRAARSGQELPVALDLAAGPCGMRADRMQLQQVFVNLLRNAVDATDGLADRGLAVSLARQGGEAVITVADRGPGLPPEVTERLFEPFVSTRPQGMGIGLAISRTIVEAHGGRIAARPRAGGGTEFVIELPLWET